MKEHVGVILHSKLNYIKSSKKVMCGLAYKKMFIIGASLVRSASHLVKRVLKPELCKTILAFDVFEKWGIDAVGPLPITSRGKSYIITAVDYLFQDGQKREQSSTLLHMMLQSLFMKTFVVSLGYHWSSFRIKDQGSGLI